MVKIPPSTAEDAGVTPDWVTKIPHVTEQLSPCTATTEHPHSKRVRVSQPKSSHDATEIQCRATKT